MYEYSSTRIIPLEKKANLREQLLQMPGKQRGRTISSKVRHHRYELWRNGGIAIKCYQKYYGKFPNTITFLERERDASEIMLWLPVCKDEPFA